MSLTLVSVQIGYNEYEDETGDEILGTPLPIVHTLTLWEDFDLSGAWFAAVQQHRTKGNGCTPSPDRAEFVEEVRREIADMSDMPEIVWCENCSDPTSDDVALEINGGNSHACPSCYNSNYSSCDDCSTVVHYENLTPTLPDSSVCDSCRDESYPYCEDCNGYYHDSDESEHHHDRCDCEPPTLSVRMQQADGETVLTEDQRVTVSLPSGVISEEGICSIFKLLRTHSWTAGNSLPEDDHEGWRAIRNQWRELSDAVTTMDPRWQTKEGNFTKRLSKLAHKTQGLKIPPTLLTQVGNIARDNSQGTEIDVELTRDLNLPAEDFYHDDSCWWQSYSESRCSLKNNGGIGMRTFGGPYNSVQGRAWIMPLKLDESGKLQPTFDAVDAAAYVVFNGYGDLSGYIPARIVAGWAGMTYRKIGFSCSPMYVNGNSAYLVASEEIAEKIAARGSLSLDVAIHSPLYHTEKANADRAALVAV